MEQPTIQQPAMQQPTIQQPTVQQPTVQQPKMQQPTVQQPITRNSVIDRVPLIDTPPAQQDWAHLSNPEQDQGAAVRLVESGSSGASEIPE